jgi:hypothetical protein
MVNLINTRTDAINKNPQTETQLFFNTKRVIFRTKEQKYNSCVWVWNKSERIKTDEFGVLNHNGVYSVIKGFKDDVLRLLFLNDYEQLKAVKCAISENIDKHPTLKDLEV